MFREKIDGLAPKNVKEKVISRNGSEEIIHLEKDRKKNPTIEDVFVFGFTTPETFSQYNGKRYKTFGAIFSPDMLKNKDFDKIAELFFSTQEKTDIRKLRTTTQQEDGMFAFSSENKKNIERWIKKAKKSDAKAIKIVLDVHGYENGYLANDVSHELLYLLNKIAGDKDLCKKNIEIVNKACYAADEFKPNTMISRYNPQIFNITHKKANLMQILTNFARKVKKQSPQTNIVYTSILLKTNHPVENTTSYDELTNAHIFTHNNSIQRYCIYDKKKCNFIPISETLENFVTSHGKIALFLKKYYEEIKNNNNYNNGYSQFFRYWRILSSYSTQLKQNKRSNDRLQCLLNDIMHAYKEDRLSLGDMNQFSEKMEEFLQELNLSATDLVKHIKNKNDYELFLPEEIVKEIKIAKQTKNDLLLGNKKDVEILNDLNKINPSNKMDKNKKKHKRSNVFANMNISAEKANKTSKKMFNPLDEFNISEEANERLQHEDTEDSFEDILPENLGITAEDMTLEESDKTSEKMFNPIERFKMTEERANEHLKNVKDEIDSNNIEKEIEKILGNENEYSPTLQKKNQKPRYLEFYNRSDATNLYTNNQIEYSAYSKPTTHDKQFKGGEKQTKDNIQSKIIKKIETLKELEELKKRKHKKYYTNIFGMRQFLEKKKKQTNKINNNVNIKNRINYRNKYI